MTTKNNRIFEGKLVSIDFRSNIIMTESVAEILPEYNVPLNYTLDNAADGKLKFDPDSSLSE